MSRGSGTRCSLCCDHSQTALTGCSPVRVGTISQPSQDGTFVLYVPTNMSAANSVAPHKPQTKNGASNLHSGKPVAYSRSTNILQAEHVKFESGRITSFVVALGTLSPVSMDAPIV